MFYFVSLSRGIAACANYRTQLKMLNFLMRHLKFFDSCVCLLCIFLCVWIRAVSLCVCYNLKADFKTTLSIPSLPSSSFQTHDFIVVVICWCTFYIRKTNHNSTRKYQDFTNFQCNVYSISACNFITTIELSFRNSLRMYNAFYDNFNKNKRFSHEKLCLYFVVLCV